MSNTSLSYDNVALIPDYFSGGSRSEISTAISFGNHTFNLPVVPANMKCVINESLAVMLGTHGYFYSMHRFDIDQISFIKKCAEAETFASISVGVSKESQRLIRAIARDKHQVDYVTIDIAHGHCKQMADMIKYVRKYLPSTYIIAGNVGTVQGYNDLAKWGANAIKVGIGPGRACTTFLKTGFMTPMFSVVRDVYDNRDNDKALIIADGGVRHNGDIAKAIVAGADLVMVGSLFATCCDSPATIDDNGNVIYYGSASATNKGNKKNIEGTDVHLPVTSFSYLAKLSEIEEDLQSANSYAGGRLSTHTKFRILH